MCELFGISGSAPIQVNEYLKEFFSHSVNHPDGWGMAVFDKESINLEKEPICAVESHYLKERIKSPLFVQNMMAHIRLATRGVMSYENCHPFIKSDFSGRKWTLIHNGTIFHCPVVDKFINVQQGLTDSERILYYIIEKINDSLKEKEGPLDEEERCEVIDRVILQITPNNNKVNLLLYDGELCYVHTNFKNTLYQKKEGSSIFFSTVALDMDEWNPVTFMQLEVYKDGDLIFTGTKHKEEYIL